MKVTVNNLEKEEVIDWSKVQLVISKDSTIVMVTLSEKPFNDYCFCGVNLKNGSYFPDWVRELFEPFHGSITLQND